ncbi:MAG: HI0074 family nucleotidyltransferase substrate-binding subunit [Thermoanaerobaculia bacterium]
MEKLNFRIREFERALNSLKEVLKEPYSVIVRDSTIKRFEYTFDLMWKSLKDYLNFSEGILCNSPKKCFREAFSVGIIDEEQTTMLIEMTDDRNLTSHTYIEKIAENIYSKISTYVNLMEFILGKIKK